MTTVDKLLNGRFAVEQPAKGYRIAVDTLLLASAVPLRTGQAALDLGCGVGGIMLALACRVPETFITGIEIQSALASLCRSNIQRNGWGERLNVKEGDVTKLDENLKGTFDHVVFNPPYHDAARHGGSPSASKRRANTDEDGELELWMTSAAQALKTGGIMTLINRADRQEEILEIASRFFGALRVKPIWSKHDGTCKRIIVRGTLGSSEAPHVETPFVLYGEDGRYSDAGNLILREAQDMAF